MWQAPAKNMIGLRVKCYCRGRIKLSVWGVALVLCSCFSALPVSAEPVAKTAGAKGVLTLTLDGDAGYKGSSDRAGAGPLGVFVNGGKQQTSANWIRFGDLGEWIRGDGIEILEAKLQLYYYDEYWSTRVYYVTASRSLDGTATNLAEEPECRVKIPGCRLPRGESTPLSSWVDFPIKPETVKLWVQDEEQNKGLVLRVPKMNKGNGEKWWQSDPNAPDATEDLATVASAGGNDTLLGPRFRSCDGPPGERPRLVVRYSVTGNAPPASPKLAGIPAMSEMYDEAVLILTPSSDPNGDAFKYEIEATFDSEGENLKWKKADAAIEGSALKWRFGSDWVSLASNVAADEGAKKGLWLRVRAVDLKGSSSRWETAGPYVRAERIWTVWGTDGNRKIWPDSMPDNMHGGLVKIQSAKNEWDSFQIAVASHGVLSEVKIEAGEFQNARDNKIAAPVVYREHYMPVAQTANRQYGRVGMVPDALVPLVHPVTGQPTGGMYGGNAFNILTGQREVFWFDVYVPKGTPAGTYRGSVNVTAKGLATMDVPVELEVFDFELPSLKQLRGFFQLSDDAVAGAHQLRDKSAQEKFALAHQYLEMLHDHYIDSWSPITGFNYGRNGVIIKENNGKVSVDWTVFDKTVSPYLDGSAFRDKVPARCLFVPYYLPIKGGGRLSNKTYKSIDYDLFGQYIAEVQRHMQQKGWLDKAYVFYFDEPFLQGWKYDAFLQTAKVIRQKAPTLKILITDGYLGEEAYKKIEHIKEPITEYVDVWDPVTFQVRTEEQANFYRARKKQGKFDIWCQTLGNASAQSPLLNLFPEYDMPFHRMWGAASWDFGFQGIEWWETIVYQRKGKRVDPWTDPVAFPPFDKPLNCDGRLFYDGVPEKIGGPDIPISCLRMKSLRDAIEDYEYFHMLEKLGWTEQEFDFNVLQTTTEAKSKAMKKPMPQGKQHHWCWWEGDPDAIMAAREKVARLIVQKQKGR